MIDINLIRNDPEYVRNALRKKGFEVDFSSFFRMDGERKALLQNIEALKAQRNKVSASVPARKKAGEDVESLFKEMRQLGDEIAAGDEKLSVLSEKIN